MKRSVLVAATLVLLHAIIILVLAFAVGLAAADEAPISGTVKSVDPAAQTVTIVSTAKGKTREVVVHIKPGGKVVRFTRSTAPGQTGFVEQPVALADLKPGWIVSAATKHEGDTEVAELVKVVLER